MAFSYEQTTRRRRLGPTLSNQRTALGYWLPLGVTVTAAAVGLAAWAWKEHRDSEGDEYLDYSDNAEYARRLEKERRDLGQGPNSFPGPPGAFQPAFEGGSTEQDVDVDVRRAEFDEQGIAIEDVEAMEQEGFVAQMRGAIRRTPSPQKLYEGAKERVTAGFQAVGKGLTSITEEKDDYVDHERWSEEADSKDERDGTAMTTAAAAAAGTAALARSGNPDTTTTPISSAPPAQPRSRGRKRTVAIIVSAESSHSSRDPSTSDNLNPTYEISHASILSHLIGHPIPDSVDLLILIYAPTLQSHPLSSSSTNADADPDAAEGDLINTYTSTSSSSTPSALYTALTTQATSLVTHPTHILPFTTPTGHIHLLKHLAPNLVYMQESLCGEQGGLLREVEGWVGQVIVLIGAEGAGLVDTETEDEGRSDGEDRAMGRAGKGGKWWTTDPRIGFGKGIEIVEGMRVGEDWEKRVGAR
ncbi:MAG: hypothetical protein M1828_001344 [Chrysothrix sp. TS-e1954]|nr:MAG: hypothetical protein M1828_001344 [Chrysothrix sp. TS-e1954]